MYLGSMEIVAGGSRRLFLFLAPVAGLALACWPAKAAAGDDLPSSGVVSVENAVAGLAGSPFGYTARTWQSDEGLPNNYVRAIVQTPDGYLWVGTSAGLARFDGLHFTAFRSDTPHGPGRATRDCRTTTCGPSSKRLMAISGWAPPPAWPGSTACTSPRSDRIHRTDLAERRGIAEQLRAGHRPNA